MEMSDCSPSKRLVQVGILTVWSGDTRAARSLSAVAARRTIGQSSRLHGPTYFPSERAVLIAKL